MKDNVFVNTNTAWTRWYFPIFPLDLEALLFCKQSGCRKRENRDRLLGNVVSGLPSCNGRVVYSLSRRESSTFAFQSLINALVKMFN